MLETWNKREGALAAEQVREKGETALSLPLSKGAYVGQDLDEGLRERVYAEGARTAPGRENGGNIDIASLTRGTKMYLVSSLRLGLPPFLGSHLKWTIQFQFQLADPSPSTSPAPTSPWATSISPKATANPPPR